MEFKITEELVKRALALIDAGLVYGIGDPEPGKMCIEAAINFAMGAPHGDQPQCVAPALRRLKITLNDQPWSSDQARAKGLRRLGIAQLGSAGALDESDFAKSVATLAIRTYVPQALRSAASICKDESHKALLMASAEKCENEPTEANAREANKTAAAAANTADADAAHAAAYAAYAASDAAYVAADAARAPESAARHHAAHAAAYVANAATYAADAAANAATYAARAAANAAARAANAATYAAHADASAASAASAARDKALADFAEGVVQILIDMCAPGCEWLFLTDAA